MCPWGTPATDRGPELQGPVDGGAGHVLRAESVADRGAAVGWGRSTKPALLRSLMVGPGALLLVQVPGASERLSRLFQLLYSKFTELLEDFHVWASVHSRPSGRGLLHTPRLSVAFALLCAYACLAALVTAAGHEQV